MDERNICLDTSVPITFLKGREPGAAAVEKAVRSYACFVTAIAVYELLFGMARAARRIGEDELLGGMTVLGLDNSAASRAALLHDDLIRRNHDIGVKDVLIAAICLAHDMPLLSLNQRHFSRVSGLQVVTPAAFLATSV
jgi:tRNA(fMet)-specific endonuclease VapC